MKFNINDIKKKLFDLSDDFMYFNSERFLVTKQEVLKFEKKFKIQLPEEYKEFVLTLGAIALEVDPKIWPRPQEFDVLPYWKFNYGFHVLGFSTDARIPSDFLLAESSNKPDEIMFFKLAGGEKAFFRDGEISLNNDEDFYDYDGSFYDFLMDKINTLERDYFEILKQ